MCFTHNLWDPSGVSARGGKYTRRGGADGFDPLFSKEVREAFSNKITEENEIDEMVDNSKFQIMGEHFVQNMLTSVAKHKLHKVAVHNTVSLPSVTEHR